MTVMDRVWLILVATTAVLNALHIGRLQRRLKRLERRR
jgi:hypothetical protein